MARPERFELPTTWFVARYSIQLSYGRIFNFSGGERGIRTLDGILSHTPLAGERLRPLGHLSNCVTTFGVGNYNAVSSKMQLLLHFNFDNDHNSSNNSFLKRLADSPYPFMRFFHDV